ncbi:PQQ-dependent sugar dehydrogenase [Nonomuraea pusilla]|uniref:Glucose/arabinose dehydrogenase, beta-propeller fold n=1 Tax=Nonomuraea pusilla TaxID=46177 RepID=A0A1H7YNM6_9ACTN|nr:PQQ-dependent sugar dehydrogenase [Nonomuraea pusilla]SEM46907.1 Glucose/arabinose dehydrogenase, beta-propeller fold [Nonomuraea pusilla]
MNVSKPLSSALACLLVLGAVAVPAAAAPTRYEAENATISQGVVASDHAGYSGAGFVNGDNVAGSFTEWTVNAPAAGTATLSFRYANGATADRPSDIAVNGATVAAARSFPSTGAWTTWTTVTLTAPLVAGANKVRATATEAGGNPNWDYLDAEVRSSSFTDYQAESATISQGVVASNHAGFTGSGFVDYDNVAGSSVEFAVSAAAAGTQSLTFRFANGTTADRPMTITVNGSTVAAGRSFPGTGAWTTWQEITVNAQLRAGGNTVRATAATANGGPNLDRLRVTGPGDTEKPTPPGQPACSDIAHDALTLDWPPSTDDVAVAAYDVYHLGQQIATATAPPYRLTGLDPDFAYRLSVFARDASGNVSLSSPEVTCRTLPVPADDPPSPPGRPTVSGVGATSATVTWAASTDDGGVRAYLVRDHANGAVLATVTGSPPATTASVPLECARTYQLHVVARDTAGQLSQPGPPSASFTTGNCGSVPQPPTTVAGGWDVPWDISWAPDGSYALVTERDTFKVFKVTPSGAKTQVGTVPDVQTTGGEGGLMGLDFSPTWNGTTDKDVFFMHTASEGNRVARMAFDGATLSGYATLLQGIDKNRYHNGGRIRFGPDGYLYVATGDAQQSGNAPDLDSLNGKILRITRTGAAAPGNPFGTRVYSYGHRNPQGLAWDSAGRLWSSELGNSSRDELNLIQPGRNYGWPTCEGACGVSGMTDPKYTWGVAEASPSGIAIVGSTLFMAALRGKRLWRVVLNGENVSTVNSSFNGTYGRLRAVEKVPGANAIWFGSTNSDANGDGSADVIRRSAIQ